MSYMLVFYLHNHITDVIDASAAPEGAVCGNIIKIRCTGLDYEAKILYIGQREVCELKAANVSKDGELLNMDDSESTSFQANEVNFGDDIPTCSIDRNTSRAALNEDVLSAMREDIAAIRAEVSRTYERVEHIEQMIGEILRRLPVPEPRGELVFRYANETTVAEIYALKGSNITHFALALEREVYKEDPTELDLPVEKRIRTMDKVIFIQQCLYKFCEVPEHLREDTWKRVKEALNSRVRRLRKQIRDRNQQLCFDSTQETKESNFVTKMKIELLRLKESILSNMECD